MPVPANIAALSTTAGANSPPGSEAVTTVDDYLRAFAAFIAQLRDEKLETSAVSAYILTLLNDADAAAARATLGAAEPEQPGVMKQFAGSAAPTGWLLCNGSAVSRTTYAALFAVVGSTFGAGNGSTTFNLPDARSRVLIGAGSLYAVGATGGNKDAVVVAHSHTVTDPGHTHVINLGLDVAAGTGFQKLLPGDGYTENTTSAATGISVNSSGVSGVDANLQPYLAVNMIIKT